MHKPLILMFTLAVATAPAFAKPCSLHASDFTVGGEPLTYDKAKSLRGVTTIGDTVHVGPIDLPNGFKGRVAIEPDGCARVVNMLSPHG